jgi:hypothetical protein
MTMRARTFSALVSLISVERDGTVDRITVTKSLD